LFSWRTRADCAGPGLWGNEEIGEKDCSARLFWNNIMDQCHSSRGLPPRARRPDPVPHTPPEIPESLVMAENEKKPPQDTNSPDSSADQPPPEKKGNDSDGDSILDFGIVAPIHEGASGVIPLADLPDPTSSPSLVSWTEVIRQHRETAQAAAPGAAQGEPVKIDAKSDQDLLHRIAEEEKRKPKPSAGPGARDTDKLGAVPLITGESASGSSIQLEKQPRGGGQPPSGSTVRFDVSEPPSDAGGAMPMPWSEAGEVPEALPASESDLWGSDVPVAEALPAEEESLSFTTGVADADAASPSSILDILISEEDLNKPGAGRAASDIVDFGAAPPPKMISGVTKPSSRRPVPPTQGGAEPPAKATQPIRPGGEWGATPTQPALDADEPGGAVDLYAEGPVSQGITDSGSLQISDEEMAGAARREKNAESSAVDLSTSGSLSSQFEMDVHDAGDFAEVVGDDVVDMDLPVAEVVRDPGDDDIAAEFGIGAEAEPAAAPAPRSRRGAATFPSAPAVAVEEENEPPAPARPGRASRHEKAEAPRRKRGGLLLGTFFGLLLGAGGLGAALYFEAIPHPKKLVTEVVEGKKEEEKKPEGQRPEGKNPNTAPAATPEVARGLLDAGRLEQAVEVYAKCDQENPEVLAGEGRAKWLAYLRKAVGENKAPNRQDADVTAALTDLKAAVAKFETKQTPEAGIEAARAYVWQGQIEEAFGDYGTAAKIYDEAAGKLPAEAKPIVVAASNRLKAIGPATPAVEPLGQLDGARLLLAFTLLLADEPAGVPPEKELAGQESGFLFWEAMLLAVKHDYAGAAAKVPAVKAVHARQQVKMAGKGLNPLSDPREQILPACLDELQRYWLLCDQLYRRPEAKMLVEQKKLPEALAASLAKGDEVLKVIAEKLTPKKDESPAAAIEAVIKAKQKAEDDKKAADEVITSVAKSVKDAGIDEPKVEEGVKKLAASDATLKSVASAVDKAGIKEPDVAKAAAGLIAEHDALKGVRERLEKAKVLDADANAAALLKSVDEAITRGSADAVVKLGTEKKAAETRAEKLAEELDKTKKADAEELAKVKKDDAEKLTASKKETADQKAAYESKLASVRTPEQVVNAWVPALADRDRAADTAAATADAELVLKNPAADEVAKAKALAVKALALRNQGKVSEAREAFAEARKAPGFEKAKDQPWAKDVARAADILENPSAFVGIGADAAPPSPQKLLDLIEGGLKLFPAETHAKDNARLLARRSLLKLEQNDAAGAAADAEAALKGGAGAEAQFALARALEAQGKLPEAEAAYREVIKAGKEYAAQAQLGLARVLLQKAVKKPAREPAAPEASAAPPVTMAPEARRAALVLLVTMLQPTEPSAVLEITEALKLADALIVGGEPLGHIIKADALAKLNRYNDALAEYSRGIKGLKVNGVKALPREYDGVLDRILAQHPALQKPDPNLVPDDSLAIKHYSDGLEFYRKGDYKKAEVELVQAIRYDPKDARYHYFLGMARWHDGRHEAATEDFKAGSLLELRGQPTYRVVNASLERVQGDLRKAVEKYRP
jgi:tetratricopeptide (TPR) repeat protein